MNNFECKKYKFQQPINDLYPYVMVIREDDMLNFYNGFECYGLLEFSFGIKYEDDVDIEDFVHRNFDDYISFAYFYIDCMKSEEFRI